MALYIDDKIADLVDLASYENGILELAKAAEIDLGAKLRAAWEELGWEIEGFLRRNAGDGEEVSLSQVVATGQVKRCVCLKALALAYRDASGGEGAERYERRRQMYEALYAQALRELYRAGVGVVSEPLCAGGAPVVKGIAGAGFRGSIYVGASWVNARGEEGAVSEVVAVEGDGNQVYEVQVGGAPAGATGWNLYAGWTPEALQLQNSSPMGLTETWLLGSEGPVAGRSPGTGQPVERWVRETYRLRRG